MKILFTRHAVERYCDFHCMDERGMTLGESRDRLEGNAQSAVKLDALTSRGDQIWMIESLGIEIVVKPEEYGNVCVTVLPPPEFRGLTPVQAERIADLRRASDERRQNLLSKIEMTPASAAPTPQDACRLHELKAELAIVSTEHMVLGAILKTMRHKLTSDQYARQLRHALKHAIRFIRTLDQSQTKDVLVLIGEQNPGYLTDAFIHEGDLK